MALVCAIFATTVSVWASIPVNGNGTRADVGIWEKQLTGRDIDTIRTCSILVTLLLFAGWVLKLLRLFDSQTARLVALHRHVKSRAASLVLLCIDVFAVILSIVPFALFVDMIPSQTDVKLGPSFALAVTTFVLQLCFILPLDAYCTSTTLQQQQQQNKTAVNPS